MSKKVREVVRKWLRSPLELHGSVTVKRGGGEPFAQP